ncbi:acetoacetyl-CoA synthetase [Octopus bimaculoides]|uniref:acetoacetyl-CoA synthetase n=1 Tax=Octopus bimaculoides TaxID=37653 RepID=UPI0022E3E0E9|nr:acetoacetyl-CoA synthetase [Octopus bimaculoides]
MNNDLPNDSRTQLFNPGEQTTQMDRLREIINRKYSVQLANYADFHKWSCDNYAEFWEEVWHFAGVVHSKTYDKVIDKRLKIADIPEWFSGSELNYAENLLRFNDDRIAIYATREGSDVITKRTFADLHRNVALYASAMKHMGVVKGDRVVGYLPNCCEAVEAMLAAASIGAIWSSTSPDFGTEGVLERFSQIEPKLMFTVNAVFYNNKVHDHLNKVRKVIQGLPDLEKKNIIVFVSQQLLNLNIVFSSCLVEDFLQSATNDNDNGVPPLQFEQLPFKHPLFIMYSSGTTGPPKCIVHSAGGTLLKHLEEHSLQSNMTQDDIMFYYTTAGWMMWNWLVSTLALGSAIVLYDGSPLMPHPNVLWDLIDNIGITIFGTGAKWLSLIEEKGLKPAETHNLKALRMILSTGSPLKPQSYDYVYNHIKSNILLGSISGGTDIIACFMGQNWTIPVYRGEIQSFALGCAMESWDENGHHVLGQSGELVCTKPFPSMPIYFWNDPQNFKYKKAYFSKFAGVWVQGDFCKINPDTGGIVMLGRSDGTLNPNGVRFGSAEIYQVVETFVEIQDCLCVAQRKMDGSDERAVLFIKMANNQQFTEELKKDICSHIRTSLSSRHVPARVLPIKDIPYTINGKKVEIAISKIISGQNVSQRGTLSNPESLDLYSNIEVLQNY